MVVRRSGGMGDLAHPRCVILAGHRGEGRPITAVGKPRQPLHSVGPEAVHADVGDLPAVARVVAVRRPERRSAGRSLQRQLDERAKAFVLAAVVELRDDALIRKLGLEMEGRAAKGTDERPQLVPSG